MAGFSLTISATDKVTAVVDRMNARLEAFNKKWSDRWARMAAPVKNLNASMQKFGQLSGASNAFRVIGRGFSFIASSAMSASGWIASSALGIGALTATGVIAGFYKLSTAWAAFSGQLGKDAARIGTTAGKLNSLQGAARLAGATAEDMTGALTSLGDVMQDAVSGNNMTALRVFEALGIDIRKSSIEAMSGAERFEAVAEALSKIQNPSVRARYGNMLLGGSYAALAPLIAKGRKGIQELREESERLNPVNEEAVRQGEKLAYAQWRLGEAFKGTYNSIVSKLAPALTPLIDRFTDWLALNKDWLALKIEEKFTQISTWLQGDQFQQIITDTREWGEWIGSVVERLGGLETVLKGLFALMALKFTVGMVTPFFTLAAAIGKVGSALAGISAGGALAGLTNLFKLLRLGSPVGWVTMGAGLAWGNMSADPITDKASPGGAVTAPGSVPQRATPAQRNQTAQRYDEMVSMLKARGMSEADAMAFADNFLHESNMAPDAVHPNGQASGLAQWLGPRRRAFREWHKQNHGASKDPHETSAEVQADFVMHELRTTHRHVADRLRNARTQEEKTKIVNEHYEVPSLKPDELARFGEHRVRLGDAQRARRAQQASPVQMGPPAQLNALQPQANTPGPQSSVQGGGNVNVAMSFSGVPWGTSINTNATGNVTVEPPRVGYSMLAFG